MSVSQYYSFDASRDCVGIVHCLRWEPLSGTNEETKLPVAKTLDVVFHVQGTVQAWPSVFSGDDYRIKLFSLPLAERLSAAGFSGIEFQPVKLELGEIGALTDQLDRCPGYVWGRVTGVLLVDLFVNDVAAPTDRSGMFLLKRPDVGKIRKMRIREDQPFAADFCRVVPGGSARIAVSDSVFRYFDALKLAELRIGTVGGGYL